MMTPKTGATCSCKRGVQRNNCPNCEGTGRVIDFAAIRAATMIRQCECQNDAHFGGPIGRRGQTTAHPYLQAFRGNDVALVTTGVRPALKCAPCRTGECLPEGLRPAARSGQEEASR